METDTQDVSVIVPIYNAENTLIRCVETIQAQTHTNIDIILVNDGSSDSSGAICDELAEKDERVRVIHQLNGGVSSARNAGIQAATTPYICFVDSDDEVEPDYVAAMYERMVSSGVGLVVCNYKSHTKERTYMQNIVDRQVLFEDISFTDCRKLLDNSYMWGPCNKMYHRGKLVENEILFDGNIAYAEDAVFAYQYLLLCDGVEFVAKPLYHYNMMNSTASRKYYPRMNEFVRARFDSQCAFVSKKLQVEEKAKQQLTIHLAVNALMGIMRYYVRRSDRTFVRSMFESVYAEYIGYIKPFLDEREMYFNETDWNWVRENRKWLETANVHGMYRRLRRSLRIAEIKKRLRIK